jgi:hypothetical protein
VVVQDQVGVKESPVEGRPLCRKVLNSSIGKSER